ncbi:phytochelatin synthase family protein [Pseudanabaena yagii]|uniref:glutathione gamma-glutamylcysteinyltransferase n=1 Tax=Pseudanabaena yagii GIHE-NHR1 TaxID=2722753 RepID=A0ABX1LZA6_9CYAN|nr:phytochelatin synthase family protein [Pseudanabaena yagii]NMF60771.1 glutathione gamma-glutamylcysteinyltransferase [Pseudanabaena yagii GIHE-NHR1]
MKIVISIVIKAFILSWIFADGVFAQTLKLPSNLIPFNSSEGEKLLINSQFRNDYFPLSIHFITQKNQAYCGVASMVMVLNALNIAAPETPEYPSFHMFTQENFFNSDRTRKVSSASAISRRGMNLERLAQLLESYDVKVKIYHAGDIDISQFRQLVADNLKQPNNFVIVNYLRKSIGQETGGHISPIAAYDQSTDRFLILDVSRYKYPPVWVKAQELWQAIATVDLDGGKTRGFVLISR